MLGALCEGESRLDAKLAGAEVLATVSALRALGCEIELCEAAAAIRGRGLRGLRLPAGVLDCGSSYPTLALLSGVLSGQHFGTRLVLAPSALEGGLDHLLGALRARGAHIAASGKDGEAMRPPVAVAPLLPDEPLRGLQCSLPAPDALAKGSLLLSGLFAAGETAVSEPLLSSDHMERMLTALEVPVRRLGSMAGFDPSEWSGRLPAFGPWRLPGDTTLAAFIAAAASVLEGSRVALRDVGFNPTRTGFFDALRLLGGRMLAVAKGDRAGHEPVAEVQVQGSRLRGGVMGGEIPLRCEASLPALCLLGARSVRGLELADADPYAPAGDPIWDALAGLVGSFGAVCDAQGAGLSIHPATRLQAARVDAREDLRLALTAVILGLAAEGETLVQNASCLVATYPDLIAALRQLGADVRVEEQPS